MKHVDWIALEQSRILEWLAQVEKWKRISKNAKLRLFQMYYDKEVKCKKCGRTCPEREALVIEAQDGDELECPVCHSSAIEYTGNMVECP